MDHTVILGAGALNWHAGEGRTGRYGAVYLDRGPDGGPPDPAPFDAAPIGSHGRLVAVVLGIRSSSLHLGGLAHGVGPNVPTVIGEEITLGIGTLFVESSRHGYTEIGVKPDDERDDTWLDPTALYRCHEQTVRLELRPGRQM